MYIIHNKWKLREFNKTETEITLKNEQEQELQMNPMLIKFFNSQLSFINGDDTTRFLYRNVMLYMYIWYTE